MVVISETSKDGSDGCVHRNKKRKVDDNGNKKRKVDDNGNKKLKEKVEVSCTLIIPNHLILDIFLRLQRCHYPSLSLVCSAFRGLMPMLYKDRLRLGKTESVLYAYVGFPHAGKHPRWYILQRKPYRKYPNMVSLRLGKIHTLPHMPWGCTVVTIGSDIYVIGGRFFDENSTSDTLEVVLIDCKSHECRLLPSMKVARCRAAAGVIDGKIYVIGGCKVRPLDWVEVFDVKKKNWSSVPGPYPIVNGIEFLTYAVMNEKIYCLDMLRVVHVYDPKAGKWVYLAWQPGLLPLHAMWNASSCVIDNLLFSVNPYVNISGVLVKVYDPELKNWFPLKGLQGFPHNISRDQCKMANFDGKLVILGAGNNYADRKREIWCVEIAWERRNEDGAFWGKVESVAVVLTPPETPSVELCRTVRV